MDATEENVELKDVPNGGESQPEETEKPTEVDAKEKKSKFRFFHREKHEKDEKKDTPKEEEKHEEGQKTGDEATELLIKDEENGDVKVEQPKKSGPRLKIKKIKFAKVKFPKRNKETTQEDTIDLTDRDHTHVNPSIALSFEDVFGEPHDQHSADCNWRAANCIFTRGRGWCYKALTLPLVIPLAIIWAAVFAVLSCFQVWAVRPGGHSVRVFLGWFAGAWAFIIRSIFDPIFQSVGMCWKKKSAEVTPVIEIA